MHLEKCKIIMEEQYSMVLLTLFRLHIKLVICCSFNCVDCTFNQFITAKGF
jgi:hypothetical protein